VFARIEILLKKIDISAQPSGQILARGKRMELLQGQRGDQGKQAHGIVTTTRIERGET
jgi:hypothetical protein